MAELLRFFYTNQWKPLLGVVSILNAAVLVGLLRLCWVEPVGEAYGIVFLLGVCFAFVQVEFLGRYLGCEEGPIFDWSWRPTWILAIGMVLALGLLAGLAFKETQDRQSRRKAEAESKAEQEERLKVLNDPNVLRATEYLQRRGSSTTRIAS